MPITYIAYTRAGQKVTGSLSVESESAAEEWLWRSDLVVASLRKVGPPRKLLLYQQLPTFFRPKVGELVAFSRELATLLQSGIPLRTALRLLQERVQNPWFKSSLQEVTSDIESGASLSRAIARQTAIFPPIYSRMVQVGEETGRLEVVLQQVATYVEKEAAMGRRVRRALTYPTLVVAVGLVAGTVMVTFSLPAMTSLFKEYGATVPLPTRILIAASNFLGQYGPVLVLGLILSMMGLALYFRTPSGARRRDYLLLRIPRVGRVALLTSMSRFVTTLHSLLVAGLPITEAIEMCRRSGGNARVMEALAQVREGLLMGQSLSHVLASQSVFPTLIPQMVSVGEQGGTLTRNLETLSNFFDQETEQAVSSLTGMIEPTLILTVGGVVAFIAVALVSSLYGMIQQIQ